MNEKLIAEKLIAAMPTDNPKMGLAIIVDMNLSDADFEKYNKVLSTLANDPRVERHISQGMDYWRRKS